jgi:hypothetical protein
VRRVVQEKQRVLNVINMYFNADTSVHHDTILPFVKYRRILQGEEMNLYTNNT